MKRLVRDRIWLAGVMAITAVVALVAVGCGGTEEIVKEVVVEKIVEKEVIKEVPVEVIVEREVIKEVPVQVVVEKEVVKEVIVEKPVIVEKEVVREVVIEKPVIVEKEVVKTVAVEVEVPVGGPQGELIYAMGGPPAVSGWPSKCGGVCYWTALMNVTETLLHGGKDGFGNQQYLPKVLESWQNAPDGSYTDFMVKRGNYFHQGFGEVTAEDIVYSANEADPRCASAEAQALANPVRHSGLPDGDYGCWQLIDKYTVRQPWTGGHPGVRGFFEITDDAYPWGVYSKRVYDEMGWEWMRDNVVGSGPYEYVEMTDDRWTMVARLDPENEDEKIPYVNKWTIMKVPEATTRAALFEAQQTHLGGAQGDEFLRFLKLGYIKPTPNGGKLDATWNWMGNYWETVHPVSGEPLVRTHREENPWICAPGPDPLKPEDSACNDVAKKFRKALYTAMPRKELLDTFYGAGTIILSPISNLDDFIIRKYGDIWGDPYDADKAKALFEEWKVDYRAMGKDPDAIVVHAWGGGASAQRSEVSEALLTHWAELFGIDWEIDQTPQRGWAPAAWGGREGWQLVLDSSPTYRGIQMRWDSESWWNARSAPLGTNHGYEALMNSQTIAAKNEAWDDPAELERLTVINREWHHDQGIMTGAVEGAHPALYNSSVIASWTDRHPGVPWWMWDPEYVTLVTAK